MNHEFSVNSPFLFAAVSIILLLVMAQAVFFLVRAWRQAKKLGIDTVKLKSVVKSSAIFTVVPAISILLGVIALSKKLGIPLPWLRLSVIGALTYETTAAEAAASAVGSSMGDTSTLLTASQFSTIIWVMTLGIMAGVILTPIISRRLLNGVDTLEKRDKRWGEILMSALFMGMISTFLGIVFGKVNTGLVGWIPVFVMLVSMVIMLICVVLIKKLKIKWVEDYALPISMIGAMALAIPITNAVNSAVR
ncbi:MAG: DUF5058 domain-containing protein [Firmicutes bacterium HGW-Firmicutes-16]|nr:MAG: DUF5058 domain-containing protein [Firmicutes bacterium HGW-Firmicutes-16]